MAKKMIEGGELVPSCNFEVDWQNYNANEILDEQSLEKILKDFLWQRSDRYGDTYPMFDIKILSNEGEKFEEKYINGGLLIPNPSEEHPVQLIHEHTLEDAFYSFEYIDSKIPLTVEYNEYENQKFLIGITQRGRDCIYDSQGDGGTQDQYITLRFLEDGVIRSVRSSAFASLPLELTEDSSASDFKNLKLVAKNFFSELKGNLKKKNTLISSAKSVAKKKSSSRYFEFKEKDSSKFWEITVCGKEVSIHYGKIGTAGQNTVKELPTPDEASAHAEKVIGEKIRKGYKEAEK